MSNAEQESSTTTVPTPQDSSTATPPSQQDLSTTTVPPPRRTHTPLQHRLRSHHLRSQRKRLT